MRTLLYDKKIKNKYNEEEVAQDKDKESDSRINAINKLRRAKSKLEDLGTHLNEHVADIYNTKHK